MPKFMVSLRDENFQLLNLEAGERGISLQELLRAVIIPDWVKFNIRSKPSSKEKTSLGAPQMIPNEKDMQSMLNRIKS